MKTKAFKTEDHAIKVIKKKIEALGLNPKDFFQDSIINECECSYTLCIIFTLANILISANVCADCGSNYADPENVINVLYE